MGKFISLPFEVKRQRAIDRFYQRITVTDTCWIWDKPDKKGYGFTWNGERKMPAHAFSYAIHKGEFPKGSVICHHCDNPICVNPDHLFLGTHSINAYDRIAKGRTRNQHMDKTHCPYGHPYDEENTYYDRDGRRYCRQCVSKRNKEYKQKNKELISQRNKAYSARKKAEKNNI